jgi:hypothetical protein
VRGRGKCVAKANRAAPARGYLSLALASLLLTGGSSPSPAPVTEIIVSPETLIAGTINGSSVRFHPQADGFGALTLNPQAAARLGLKAGMFSAKGRVGPVTVKGYSSVITYAVQGSVTKQRVLWFDQPATVAGDGTLGPMAFKNPIVTFRLRQTQPHERTTILPLSEKGSFGSIGSDVRVGDSRYFIQWDLDRLATLTNAPTAVSLAGSHQGVLARETGRAVIKLGVERPVRTMTLGKPFEIGPVRVNTMLVRTSDYGNANGIRSEGDDPEEIVVLGQPVTDRLLVRIGASDMAHCSTLTFDKPKKQVRLSCL